MVRRFVGGKLVEVSLDGTSTDIIALVAPRSMMVLNLKQAVQVGDPIGTFIDAWNTIQVPLPGALPARIDEPSIPMVDIMPIESVPYGPPIPEAGPPPSAMPPDNSGPGLGIIQTRFGEPPHDVEQAIMANWPQHLWAAAAEVSHNESGWSNGATNDTRWKANGSCGVRYYLPALGIWAFTEFSIGIFQINMCAHGGNESYWRDANNNSAKGYELYRSNGDWSAWAYTARSLGLPQHVL